MNVLDAFGGQRILSVAVLTERVVKMLDHPPLELIQPDVAQRRADVPRHRALVVVGGGILDADGVVRQPDVQPFVQRHGTGVDIGFLVDLVRDPAELLADLLLRFTVDGALELLSRPRVDADGVAAFPASVFSLANGARAVRCARILIVWQFDLSFLGIRESAFSSCPMTSYHFNDLNQAFLSFNLEYFAPL